MTKEQPSSSEHAFSPEQIAAAREIIEDMTWVDYGRLLKKYTLDHVFFEYRNDEILTEADLIEDIVDQGKIELGEDASFEDIVTTGVLGIAALFEGIPQEEYVPFQTMPFSELPLNAIVFPVDGPEMGIPKGENYVVFNRKLGIAVSWPIAEGNSAQGDEEEVLEKISFGISQPMQIIDFLEEAPFPESGD